MFECEICGGQESRIDAVSEIFEIDGRHVLVENIPVRVCMQCGEMSFERDTAEKVRTLVNGDTQPVGVIELEVFEFA